MSALAAPQISLEQARQLDEFLENGEQEKADQLILETATKEQSELYAEYSSFRFNYRCDPRR